MAEIKFKSYGRVGVTDDEGRSIELHIRDIVDFVRDILNCVSDMQS